MNKLIIILLTAILISTASASGANAQEKQNQPAGDLEMNAGIPSNDAFAAPTVLTLNGSSVNISGGNISATKEAGEPNHSGNAGGASVWFSFTPQATTVARIRTGSVSFDTLLAVYSGTGLNNLTPVGSNDDCQDNCAGGSSLVDLMLVGGQTYRIAVDGYNDGTTTSAGSFVLEITALNAPVQDNYANAHNLGASTGGSIAGTNYNATAEPGEPEHFIGAATKSVWYRWTPSGNYSVDFELTENFKSRISIYRAYVPNPTLAQLSQVVTAGDQYGYTDSRYRTTFFARTNVTYYIAIDGQGTAAQNSGNFQLKFYGHRLRYSYRLTVSEQAGLTVFRPNSGEWFTRSVFASSGYGKAFGAPGDVPVPADYSGDGITDIAVTRNENGNKTWYVKPFFFDNSFYAVQWGLAGDKAITGDFDRDGVADMTVIRQTPNGLIWYVRQSGDNSLRAFNWGANSDKPVIGDFDGDGMTDVAVTRNEAGNLVWYILKSNFGGATPTYTQSAIVRFGFGSDRVTAEDYDGDGKTDVAIFRPSNGTWYVLRSSDNQLQSQQFGTSGDRPQPADYNGDGKADYGIFRPSTGTWFTSLNPATNYGAIQWGADGDIPLSSMSTLSE